MKSDSPIWINWLQNLRCTPTRIERPTTIEQARQAILRARSENLVVRAAGTGHAPAALVPTEGVIVKTDRLDRLLGIQGDVIHVEAGMHLRRLVQIAARHGLAIPGTPIFADMSVAGIAATGSHGSGRSIGCFSDAVVGVMLLTADGELLEIDETTPRLLRAAQVHLGVLGLVISLKIRCQPDVRLKSVHRGMPIDQGLAEFETINRTHDFASLYWHPFTDELWVHVSDKTDEPADYGWWAWLVHNAEDHLLHGGWGALFMSNLLQRFPRLTPPFMRMTMNLKRGYQQIWDSEHGFHYISGIGPTWLASTSVPAEHGLDAFKMIMELVSEEERQGEFPVNLAVYARYVASSNAYLAFTGGRDSCCIEVATTAKVKNFRGFTNKLHRRSAELFGGRPHWGKAFFETDRIPELYGDGFTSFAAVRRELDPEGRFMNPLLAQMFAV